MNTLLDTRTTQLALELTPYAVELRHKIHEQPELGMKEVNTTQIVKRELEAMGVEILDLGMEVGCVALIHGTGQGQGKVIGLRADMDALPMQDLCGKPWASKVEGTAHTCGHDAHTAALLAAAKGLMTLRDSFSGTVKLLFQPAEETFAGAKYMISHGAMENPAMDMLTALHGTPAYHLGQYAVASGKIMASADEYHITFLGKSAHASRPVEGRNALLAAAHAIIALQEIVPNEVKSIEEAVVNTCVLESGMASNIVPDRAVISGTVRCMDPEVRKTLEAAIRRIAEASAALCACGVEIDYLHGTDAVINDEETVNTITAAVSKLVGRENVVRLKSLLGGEDFSFYRPYVEHIAFYRVGTGTPEEGPVYQLHNAHYDTNDEMLAYCIAAHIQSVLDVNG
ncbi:MAG: amidohydrolase [Oscillospiraceae bacterium]|nr:amidohydrolase [Oscillospiraceae bacterium]MBR3474779.1 amidohydrolase [Oscillospiraceae bacterium]